MEDTSPAKLFISYLKLILLLFAGVALMYSLNLLAARLIGPEQFGDLTVIIKVLMFLAPLLLLGTHEAMLYFVPRYDAKKTGRDTLYVMWSIKRIVFCALIFLLLLFCFWALVYFLHRFDIHTVDKWHAVIYALWLAPLLAFFILIRYILSAYKRVILNEVLSITPFASLFIIIVLLYVDKGSATVYELVYALAAALALFIAVSVFFIKPYIKINKLKVKGKEKKEWSTMAYQMCVGSLAFSGLLAIDVLCLEYFGAHEYEVGHYGAIMAIGSIATIFSCWTALLAPHVAVGVQSSNLRPLSKAIVALRGFSFFYLISACVLIAFFGKTLLSQFGVSYIADYPALLVFFFGVSITVLLSGPAMLLYHSGHQVLLVKLALVEIVLMFIFSWILIPKYQIMGAVISYLIVKIFARGCLFFLQKKYIGADVFFLANDSSK